MYNLGALETVGKYDRKKYCAYNFYSDTTLLIIIFIITIINTIILFFSVFTLQNTNIFTKTIASSFLAEGDNFSVFYNSFVTWCE